MKHRWSIHFVKGMLLIYHNDKSLRELVNKLIYENRINPFDNELYIQVEGRTVKIMKESKGGEKELARGKK